MAQSNAPAHDYLVSRLAPQPGERWLDIGTGAGGVALRAARAGAVATGVDIAASAIEAARAASAEEGLDVRFEVADAQALPYADGSFDVASSAFGINFASDHRAAAGELARVTRSGGRIGLMLLPPESRTGEVWTLLRRYSSQGDHPAAWGSEEGARRLLGFAFQLQLEVRDGAPPPPHTPEEQWQFFVETFGPLQDVLAQLDDERAAELRREFIALRAAWEGKPTTYLLALGVRR